MARTLRKPLPEDVDFMHASREEMANLRKALYPLTRRLAVRLARKRRHGRKGAARLPAHRPRTRCPTAACRPSRSSGTRGRTSPRSSWSPTSPVRSPPSPASRCMLVYAIGNQFSKVRSFVFIDGIDEVTGFFEGVEDINEAVHRVNTEADVVWVDGHSDYGHAFEVFWKQVGQGDRPQDDGHHPRRRPEQLPRLPVVGRQGDAAPGPPRLLAEPRARSPTGTPATRSSGSTAPTATASSSAATSASSRRFVDHLV